MATARELALNALLENEKGAFSNFIIDETLGQQDLSKEERAFFVRLVEGVIENRIFLDHVLDSFSKTPAKKMKPVIRNILRLGTYQILFMDRIPDSAAVSESVKLAIKHKFTGLKGFVNGVLRSIVRAKEKDPSIEAFLAGIQPDSAQYLSVRYSIPSWLIEKWVADYGFEQTQKMAEAISVPKPIHAWLNTSKGSAKEILAALTEEGIIAKKNELLPDAEAYYLQNLASPATSKAFQNGLFYIQDAASTISLHQLEVYIKQQPMQSRNVPAILDVCAAPGGKTLYTSVAFPQAHIDCRDLSEKKVNLIIDNIRRLGVKNVYPEVWDATKPHPGDEENYDIVIADLPCSGLGVLGRKSDIRYRVAEEDLESLQQLQRRILQTVLCYVKSGGVLMYSTCTVNHGENEENTKWILEQGGFEKIMDEQLFPQSAPYHDGFYYAIFRKN